MVQSILIGWSFEASEQQKKTLVCLYLSRSHLKYSSASVDSRSASCKIIAVEQRSIKHVNGKMFSLLMRYSTAKRGWNAGKNQCTIPRQISLFWGAFLENLLWFSLISSTMTCFSYPLSSETLTSTCWGDSQKITSIEPWDSPCNAAQECHWALYPVVE